MSPIPSALFTDSDGDSGSAPGGSGAGDRVLAITNFI
jgi:hypothetical protein